MENNEVLEKMIEYLNSSEWNCSGNSPSENDEIKGFLNSFFRKQKIIKSENDGYEKIQTK